MNRPVQKSGVAASVFMMQVVVTAIMSVFSFSAGLVYFVGMIPSLALALQKPDFHHARKVQVVFLCNLAGVVPFAKDQFGANAPAIGEALTNITAYVFMYGAAAVGYAVIIVGPMVAAMVLQMMSGERLKRLAKQRQKLIDEWGPEIGYDIDVPKPQPKKK